MQSRCSCKDSGKKCCPPHSIVRATCGAIPITACQINRGNFTIFEPGVYNLVEDVEWSPSLNNEYGINIASNNVTLDLCGHTIRQVSFPAVTFAVACAALPNAVTGNVAIWTEGTKSVTIRNGRVVGVQGVGVVGKDTDDLLLEDLDVRECGNGGAIDTSFLYRNGGIFVMGTKTPNCGGAGTIRFATNTIMRRCNCIRNTSALDRVVTLGSLILFAKRVRVEDCVFNETANTSSQPSGVQFNVVGIDYVVCEDVVTARCDASFNSSGGEPGGYFAWGRNYVFEDCTANSNYTMTGKRACGFNLSFIENVTCVRCEANKNFVMNTKAGALPADRNFAGVGFRIGNTTTRGVFQDCVANGNWTNSEQSPSAGFLLNSSSYCVFKDCIAMSNFNVNGPFGGFFAKVSAGNDVGDSLNVGNEFYNCTASDNSYLQVYTPPGQPVPLFPYPITVTGTGVPDNGAGFYLQDQLATKIINCVSNSNLAKGILIRGTAVSPSTRYIISSNTVANNTSSGIEIDTSDLGAVYENRASFNSAVPSVANYVALPAGTPVVQWNLSGGVLPGPVTSVDNISTY